MQKITTLLLAILFLPALFAKEPQLDQYGGNTAIKGNKTGWIHVQSINERWYFISPEGNAFFSLGVSHTDEMIPADDQNLLKTKYNNDPAQLAENTEKKLREWGYNSLGYGAIKPLQTKMPYVAIIETEGPVPLAGMPRPKPFGIERSKYADIYDPEVQARIRKTIDKVVQEHKDNPYCIGYVFLDLPIWHNEFHKKQNKLSFVQFLQSLGSDAPGKNAYIQFLSKRYKDQIDTFKETYKLDIQSFDELLNHKFDNLDTSIETVRQDNEDFLNEIADTYYRAIVPYLRGVDPNHLVLGDRYMLGSDRTYDSILKTASKYVDVISYQPMGTHKMSRDYINKVFEITGKPSLMVDVNCMKTRVKKDQIDTTDLEKEWSEQTRKYYLNLVESKYCIGIHRCTFRDHRPWDKKFYRRGLVKDDETPYPILLENTKKINKKVFEIVY